MKREEKKWQISSTDSSRFTKDEIIINNSFPSGFEVVRGEGGILGKKEKEEIDRVTPCVRYESSQWRDNTRATPLRSGRSFRVGEHRSRLPPYCPSHHPLIRLFVLA